MPVPKAGAAVDAAGAANDGIAAVGAADEATGVPNVNVLVVAGAKNARKSINCIAMNRFIIIKNAYKPAPEGAAPNVGVLPNEKPVKPPPAGFMSTKMTEKIKHSNCDLRLCDKLC